ncbi:MAG TPA: ABC transporter ATP-binding protein [Phycisphaerales bacterium]|nr:ABC transporter ATP-binding protein [Phycisphaerales bacterium]
MSGITIHGLTKRFGPPPPAASGTTAVDAIDLTIDSGELFFLLGPSGCGKTTLLRMIAGFIDPTAGTIRFDQREVTHLPPNRRNTGMVFQSYALWPHMTVAQNVAYGLDVRKIAADEKKRRVMEALCSVHMDEYAERKPNQLSGGQQQRVALARALVIQPTVLLLDEPLSNLDAKLRLEMRSEIRRICKASGITGVYVTHDQKEALSMADRMAVLRAGRIVQVGGPRELYEHPRTRFVADFLGETNFLDATVRGVDGEFLLLDTPAGVLRSPAARGNPGVGKRVTCSIRPETWRLLRPPAASVSGNGQNASAGKLTNTTYLGEVAQHIVALGPEISVRVLELNPGLQQRQASHNDVRITVNPDDVVILDD